MILHNKLRRNIKLDAKWKLSKYKKTRSAEERETIVIQVEMEKDTPQLKTEAQDAVSSAAIRRICVLYQESPRVLVETITCIKLTDSFKIFILQINYTERYIFNTSILLDIKCVTHQLTF